MISDLYCEAYYQKAPNIPSFVLHVATEFFVFPEQLFYLLVLSRLQEKGTPGLIRDVATVFTRAEKGNDAQHLGRGFGGFGRRRSWRAVHEAFGRRARRRLYLVDCVHYD